MRNAWHFHYALVLVFKVICGGFGIGVAHPLTGRYAFRENIWKYRFMAQKVRIALKGWSGS
ncbi:DUF3265 domain-containing protein [Vibrio parahaemolyticus]|nr:DUF3265 domain-containing protein [Vibrio parahaemolyticus]EGR3037772.1 DUF3265 domain-containing protein [Vibrio parahaemolyticus]